MSQSRGRPGAGRLEPWCRLARPSLAIAEAEALVGEALALGPEVAQAWCLAEPSGQGLVVLAHRARQAPPSLALPPELPWVVIQDGLGGPAPHLERTQLVVGGRCFRWAGGARGVLVLQGGPALAWSPLGQELARLGQALGRSDTA